MKKVSVYLIILVLVLLAIVVYFRFFKKEKLPQETIDFQKLIQSVSAPSDTPIKGVSEKVIKSLSTSENTKPTPIPENIIKNLSAPRR